MIIYDFYLRLKFYLGYLSSITYMNMNRSVFIQVKEKSYPKSYQQCWHDFIILFCDKDKYKILYLQVLQYFFILFCEYLLPQSLIADNNPCIYILPHLNSCTIRTDKGCCCEIVCAIIRDEAIVMMSYRINGLRNFSLVSSSASGSS